MVLDCSTQPQVLEILLRRHLAPLLGGQTTLAWLSFEHPEVASKKEMDLNGASRIGAAGRVMRSHDIV